MERGESGVLFGVWCFGFDGVKERIELIAFDTCPKADEVVR